MKKLVLISLFPLFSLSQNNKEPIPITPKNMKIGDCYEMLFNYDKKIEWNKLDCDSIPGMKLPIGMKCIYRIGYKEIKEYQNKLINLGYDLSLNGVFDKKTAEAHHKYLKNKKRAVKKETKRLRKLKRDSLKQIILQNKRSQKGP